MSNNWSPMPLKASADPLDYRSAAQLAVLMQRPYVAGPYIFCQDGSHHLRKGWVLRDGMALCEQSPPWAERVLEDHVQAR